MKRIELPERTEDFTADPVELFFDLAYVFAFSQLVGVLLHEPNWSGIGRVALLFGLLWLPWQQLTWAANAVSGNGRPIRLVFLAATVASVPMAAATSTALGNGGLTFALSLTVIMVLGFAVQALSADRNSGFGRAITRWMIPTAIAVVVLVAGALVEGGARTVLWVASVLIVLFGMASAGSGEWVLRSGHMAERHGLIVIIALGEVIVAIGLPVVESLAEEPGISALTVGALVASGTFAALLWWAYFDRPSVALEHGSEMQVSARGRGSYTRDVYAFAHAPIVAGVVLSAVALEQATLHPSDPVPQSFRLMLLAGLVFFQMGIAAAIGRAYRALAVERVVVVALLVVVALISGSWDGIWLITVVVLILAVSLWVEHVRLERPTPQPSTD